MKKILNVFIIISFLVVSIFTIIPLNTFAERGFTSAINYIIGGNPFSVTSGDFNGDTYLDLATANGSSNNVSILLGSINGTFNYTDDYATGTTPYSVTSGLFNNDAYLDLP